MKPYQPGIIGADEHDMFAVGAWDVPAATLKFPELTIHIPKKASLPCTMAIDRQKGAIEILSVTCSEMPVVNGVDHHVVEIWIYYTLQIPVWAIRHYRTMHRGYHTGIEFSLHPGQNIKAKCLGVMQQKGSSQKDTKDVGLLAKLNYQISILNWEKGQQDTLIQYLEEMLRKN